jgi:hypothetical protein
MAKITSKRMFVWSQDSITCSVYRVCDVGIYFPWCYWADLVRVKGVLCGVRGVDIAPSLWRVVEVRCIVDPNPTYMRTRGWVEGKSVCRREEDYRLVTPIIYSLFEKPLWNISGFERCVSREVLRVFYHRRGTEREGKGTGSKTLQNGKWTRRFSHTMFQISEKYLQNVNVNETNIYV